MLEHEKRIREFLSERAAMRGLCPEQISGANGVALYAPDLRALLADLDAIRAALSEAKAGGWQPIETAPRGSGIDGPDSVSHPDYVDPPKLLLWTEEGPLVGYYDWYYHPGYGCGAEDGESAWRDHSGAKTYGASAWQPLPNPPKGEV